MAKHRHASSFTKPPGPERPKRKKITIRCKKCKVAQGRSKFTSKQAERADKGHPATCKKCGGR